MLQMLEGLYENNGYEVLKRTAEDRSGEKVRETNVKYLLYSGQLKTHSWQIIHFLDSPILSLG